MNLEAGTNSLWNAFCFVNDFYYIPLCAAAAAVRHLTRKTCKKSKASGQRRAKLAAYHCSRLTEDKTLKTRHRRWRWWWRWCFGILLSAAYIKSIEKQCVRLRVCVIALINATMVSHTGRMGNVRTLMLPQLTHARPMLALCLHMW